MHFPGVPMFHGHTSFMPVSPEPYAGDGQDEESHQKEHKHHLNGFGVAGRILPLHENIEGHYHGRKHCKGNQPVRDPCGYSRQSRCDLDQVLVSQDSQRCPYQRQPAPAINAILRPFVEANHTPAVFNS